MLDVVAESTGLRVALLLLLFAIVMAAAYFTAQAITARQAARKRLLEVGPRAPGRGYALSATRGVPMIPDSPTRR